uniref:hypothetical protein n=1 Tax=Altererythrobacter segetis TaxID=1104773 RepID=UPI00140A88C9|nr:hypothetical protein [Altererythrobacter segetis]
MSSETGGLQAVPTTMTLSSAPVPQLIVDVLPDSAIIADGQYGMLARPAATPMAIEAKTQAPGEGNAASGSPTRTLNESSSGEASDTELAVQHSGVAPLAAVELQRTDPVPASVARTSRVLPAESRGTVSRIKTHLDHVKERYAQKEQLVDRGHAQLGTGTVQSVRPSAAAPREVSESSLIVHDNELVAIRLGDLVSLFEDHFDRPLFVWMTSSSAASKFVSLKTLAAAGIQAKLDPATQQVTFSVNN